MISNVVDINHRISKQVCSLRLIIYISLDYTVYEVMILFSSTSTLEVVLVL